MDDVERQLWTFSGPKIKSFALTLVPLCPHTIPFLLYLSASSQSPPSRTSLHVLCCWHDVCRSVGAAARYTQAELALTKSR